MAQMKGSAFTARFGYLRETYPDRWEAFLSELDPSTRELATSRILKSAWYPFEHFVDLNVVADRVMGQGDLALARTLGAHAAEANLPTLYRLFFKLGSPDYILRNAAALWTVHHDTGHAVLVKREGDAAEYQVHEHGSPHPTLCRSVEGFVTRSLELTGVREVSVKEIACVTEGAPYCAFEGRWRVR